MQCAQCTYQNAADAQFCSRCGGPLQLRCPGCGQTNPPNSRFCNACAQRLAVEPPGEPSAAGAGTILVVEDRPEVRELARDILESDGYTVIEARDPEEALSIAAEHSAIIDLLLTDLVLPQMNGLELSKRVGKLRPGLRVLYMSGFVSKGMLAAQFVQKPFDADTLTEKVRNALNASERAPG